MNEHIDVRGVVPLYVNGQFALKLEAVSNGILVKAPRDITVQEARAWIIHYLGVEAIPFDTVNAYLTQEANES